MKNKITNITRWGCSAIFALILILGLQGCATGQISKGSLKPMVGKATYDQVVSKWGPPLSKEKLSNGKTAAKYCRTIQFGGDFGEEQYYDYQSNSLKTTGAYSPVTSKTYNYVLIFDKNGVFESYSAF